MPSGSQIRTGFIEFFKARQHRFISSSPLVPVGDDTLLFANAGMNQFKDVFLGLTGRQCPRAVNSQKCLRVSGKHNDLEEVGTDNHHHTFFEMLGNWSFDDYFKAEAIRWAWELLTREWRIDPAKLYASVFEGDVHDDSPPDDQSADLWPRVTGMPAERVLKFGRKDNFWEMGNTGPCGPCSELHIDLGPARCGRSAQAGHVCRVNGDCGRFIELWNLVFIQYNRTEDGRLSQLPARYVDTGAGLERITAVLQGKDGNYDTDLFMPIINAACDITGRGYTGRLDSDVDTAFRVVADHMRALVFAITDGAMPSNDGRGYVVRRLLRRASRFGRILQIHEPFLHRLVDVVVQCLGDAFEEIRIRSAHVSEVIKDEEEAFGRTLDNGLEIFNAAARRAASGSGGKVSGEDAFKLYDTYGFPLDLTCLMAREQGLGVDTAGFEALMEQQRQRARQAQKIPSAHLAIGAVELPATDDERKYRSELCRADLLGWLDGDGFHQAGELEPSDSQSPPVAMILDRTCMYSEAGGQIGDCGSIDGETGRFIVERTEKLGQCVCHWGRVCQGRVAVGESVVVHVSRDRDAIKKNHTATHLLQWALRRVIGDSVTQQGSLVGPDYLRFDFTCRKALTEGQIRQVEDLVREKIDADIHVTCLVMPREQADQLGAMALFGEKYGSHVRVVGIGSDQGDSLDEAFSREFCGGTHVDHLGSIGGFKIIKEESISAGVRRITALTGSGLMEYLLRRNDFIDQLSVLLKIQDGRLVGRIKQLLEENRDLARKLKKASRSGSGSVSEVARLLDSAEKVGQSSVIVARLDDVSVDHARAAIDMLRKKAGSAAIVMGLEDDGKAILLAGMTDDLIKKGLSAGEVVRQIAPIVEGGGGGKPNMAQAGGKDPSGLDRALDKARELIKEGLSPGESGHKGTKAQRHKEGSAESSGNT